jgi:uncharacterized phage protein (TIGR02216 family)
MSGEATLDWSGLMRAGIRDLRLRPDDFWALTPSELALMLGMEQVASRMNRDGLARLQLKFPDTPRSEGGPDQAIGEDGHGNE